MIERGDVLLPDPEVYDVPWLAVYLLEFARFTGINDAQDDQVDSTTQALNYVRGLGSFDVMDFWRRMAKEAEASKLPQCMRCKRPIGDNQPYQKEGNGLYQHVHCLFQSNPPV